MTTHRLLQELRGVRSVLDDASASGAPVDVLLDLAKQVDYVAGAVLGSSPDGECDGPAYVGCTGKRSPSRSTTTYQLEDRRDVDGPDWITTLEFSRTLRKAVRHANTFWKQVARAYGMPETVLRGESPTIALGNRVHADFELYYARMREAQEAVRRRMEQTMREALRVASPLLSSNVPLVQTSAEYQSSAGASLILDDPYDAVEFVGDYMHADGTA